MRQYIGARYVPKFMGTYDATQSYEALCVVDNGLGTSYISTVPTPAGTPLTDTDYWAIYGASSGAIINLQNQIDDMNDGTVPGSLQNQINTLDTSVTGIATDLSNKEDTMAGRTFVFVGDSYDQVIPGASWVDTACTCAGIINYIKRTAGSYGFVANGVYTWYNLLVNNPFTDAEKAAVTDIVIGGGTNDTTANQTDVANAMETFDTYVKSLFPNLKRIYISYMGWSHLNATQKGQHRTTYMTYLNKALQLGWSWMNGVEYVLHNPDLIYRANPDRVHPNQDGVYTLGYTVAQALLHGCAEYRCIVSDVYEADTTKVTGSDVTISSVIDNNITEMTIPDMTFTAVTTLSSFFDILKSKDGEECNFVQYKYWPVIVASNNTFIPATLFSSDTKTLTLWLRAGATIASGASFSISTRDIMCSTI